MRPLLVERRCDRCCGVRRGDAPTAAHVQNVLLLLVVVLPGSCSIAVACVEGMRLQLWRVTLILLCGCTGVRNKQRSGKSVVLYSVLLCCIVKNMWLLHVVAPC